MDKSRIYNFIRSRYPKLFGIRKFLQQVKIKRLKASLLSQEKITACETNPNLIDGTLSNVVQNGGGILRQVADEMESMLINSSFQSQDKKKIKQDMSFCRLAYGFLPSEYCAFELENKSSEERKEFMSDIDTFIFGYTVNDIAFMQKVIDKGQSVRLLGHLFGREYLVVSSWKDYGAFKAFIRKHPVFVKKYTNSSMGRNIEKVDIREIGIDEKEYFKNIINKGKFLLEELVVQNEQMAKFNESSVNTIRCMTFRTQKGIKVPFCFMRTGRKGAFVDNGGSGGILIGVDSETGVVNSDGYDEFNNRYIVHPDSGIKFLGTQIPDWVSLLNICMEAASKISEMGYLSWDLAYTDDGWKVIEVNGIGQLIGPQMVYKKGIKQEIRRYLDEMPKVI